MMSDTEVNEVKTKNPKRVAAGKKGVEVRKMKAELRRKEADRMKTENMELKSVQEPLQITKDEPVHKSDNSQNINIYKNYMPLCITIGVVGLGLYMYKSNILGKQPQVQTVQKQTKKEIDIFEFN